MDVGQWAVDLGEHGGRLPAAQPVEHREGVGQRDLRLGLGTWGWD